MLEEMVMNVTEIFCNIKFRRNVGNMSITKKDVQEYEENTKKFYINTLKILWQVCMMH